MDGWMDGLIHWLIIPSFVASSSHKDHLSTLLFIPITLLSLGKCWTYHPPCRARALSSHMVAHSSVLTRASLLTLLPMLTRRTQVFTAASKREQTRSGYLKSLIQKWTFRNQSVSLPSSISNATVVVRFLFFFVCFSFSAVHSGLLTMPLCIQESTDIPRSHGDRWLRSGTDISGGIRCHRFLFHTGPRSASPCTQGCRCRLRWWGYTVRRSGTGTSWCSGAPSGYCRKLVDKWRKII